MVSKCGEEIAREDRLLSSPKLAQLTGHFHCDSCPWPLLAEIAMALNKKGDASSLIPREKESRDEHF